MTKRINSGLPMVGVQESGAQVLAVLAGPWFGQLRELATRCTASFSDEEADRVRGLRDLLADAPVADLIDGLVVPATERVEALIGAGACSAAALAMVGPAAGYLLSRGATGVHAASIYLPDGSEEVTAIGDSLALALVGAMAQALVDRHAHRQPAPVDLD